MDETKILDQPYGNINVYGYNSTGIVEIKGDIEQIGGIISIPDITAVYYHEDTKKTTFIEITATDIIPDYTATELYLFINVDGEIVQKTTNVVGDGELPLIQVLLNNGQITDIIETYTLTTKNLDTINEIIDFLHPIVKDIQIKYSSGLTIQRLKGTLFYKNIGNDPNQYVSVSAEDPLIFDYVLYDSTVQSSDVMDIDPNHYDNGNVLVSVSSGKFTIQRVSLTYNLKTVIQYGNIQYDSETLATLAFDDIEQNFPVEKSSIAVVGYMIMQQGATLSSNVIFIPVSNFGEAQNPQTKNLVTNASGVMLTHNNLADVASISAARTVLGAGTANGLAQLNSTSLVVSSQLPPHQPYSLLSSILVNNVLEYKTIFYLPVYTTLLPDINYINIVMYVQLSNRLINYQIVEYLSSTVVETSTITTSGFFTTKIPITGNSVITMLVKKNISGGTRPIIRGVVLQLTTS